MYTNRQRRTALIACAAYLLVMFCSALFIVKESAHDCTGENCPVCAQISEAENILQRLGNGDPSVSIAVAVWILCFDFVLTDYTCDIPYITPVRLKVRMND